MMETDRTIEMVPLSQIIFNEDLYPRVNGHDPETVQNYARDMEQIEAAGKFISINAEGILLDGRHRMLAYKKIADGAEISVKVYRYPIAGNLGSYRLACTLQDRGRALTNEDRQTAAKRLWSLGDQSQKAIAEALGVSQPTVAKWLSKTIKAEKEAKKEKAFTLWLSCHTQEEIAAAVEVTQKTISDWNDDFRKLCRENKFLKSDPPIYNVWTKSKKTNSGGGC
jgi:predicted transcriptional regulator